MSGSRIAVFGAGYAGLVTGACFAELGHSVAIRDIVPEKIAALNAGELPIFEPGLAELVERNRERLTFTLDAAEAVEGSQFVFICVDTPPTYAGDADLSRVWTVIEELPPTSTRMILVMKSTVPVGTGETIRANLNARGLESVGYVSNPEFLAEGTALKDFLEPDRIVVGAFEGSDGDAVEGLHAGLNAPVVRTDVASAEMVKLASNAFLGTRISFINEIANVCELVGADVTDVARGMGLDSRIGTRYLKPGIGFGGSCLQGDETVLVRERGRPRLTSLSKLFEDVSERGALVGKPKSLDVVAWQASAEFSRWFPVDAVTRRPYAGELLEIRTKMGRRLACTPDHPFVCADARGRISLKEARELSDQDWLPLAPLSGRSPVAGGASDLDLFGAFLQERSSDEIIVRLPRRELAAIGTRAVAAAIAPLGGTRRPIDRAQDVVRHGALRLREAEALRVPMRDAFYGTAKNGTYVPASLLADEDFWRVVGLYIAEGNVAADGNRRRIAWSFRPSDESDLVDEVAAFWDRRGVKATIQQHVTTRQVSVSSRLLAAWWLDEFGLGRTCYLQRLPDAIWDAPEAHKRALLGGLWRGDGSWSYVNGGPSVVFEYGTVSKQLADGILRLLADIGITGRLKVGRTAKSTVDTYWVIVAGADQIEQLPELVSEADYAEIAASLYRQKKRIAPTGYRLHRGVPWVRITDITRRPFAGDVYSLEVPGAHTFVTSNGLITHNCFPKDISFLKLLAGNSGYHFQLLNSVIEVNELQKRRVIGKLQKHLGSLRGRCIALLGLAFKAHTDDLREAPSIVLASRLLAEGADVRAWDPVADASQVLRGVSFASTIEEAVGGADAAVIVTEWDELRGLASPETHSTMRTPLIIDGRNLLDPDEVRAAGFAYEGIGRPSSPLDLLPETAESDLPAPARED